MKKQFWYGFIVGLGVMAVLTWVIVFVGMGTLQFPGISFGGESTSNSTTLLSKDTTAKLNAIKSVVDENYLNKVKSEDYEDGLARGLMYALDDPYSVYYSPDEYKDLMESSSGKYCGIGSVVQREPKEGVFTIAKVLEESPSQEAGLLDGDTIVKIDNKEVTGMEMEETLKLVKGEEGTKVEIEVLRDGVSKSFMVTRRQITVKSISYEMMANQIGYIQIVEFDEETPTQFRAAMKELEKKKMKGLVIDLRDNGGGLLSAVVDMLDRMLPEGLIMYTVDKNGKDEEYHSTKDEQFTKPLAILINENSASASEVFAGAIQDYGIGTLVGTTSFGKGIVQSLYPLRSIGDGSAIKLTTSKYYTPKGRNIHGTGIEPDVKEELSEELQQKATFTKEEDNQLQKAIAEVQKSIK